MDDDNVVRVHWALWSAWCDRAVPPIKGVYATTGLLRDVPVCKLGSGWGPEGIAGRCAFIEAVPRCFIETSTAKQSGALEEALQRHYGRRRNASGKSMRVLGSGVFEIEVYHEILREALSYLGDHGMRARRTTASGLTIALSNMEPISLEGMEANRPSTTRQQRSGG